MTRWLLGLAVLFTAACSGPAKPAPGAVNAPPAEDAMCPVAVAGTAVTAEDTDTGAALVFVTTGDVAELRKRVAAIAVRHNEKHGAMGAMPTGTEPAGGGHGEHAGHDMAGGEHAGHDMGGHDTGGMGGMISVHSKATSEDIEGGARLVLIVAPDNIAKLQSELRMHAQHMAGGTCHMDHAP